VPAAFRSTGRNAEFDPKPDGFPVVVTLFEHLISPPGGDDEVLAKQLPARSLSELLGGSSLRFLALRRLYRRFERGIARGIMPLQNL
jgi:hypothetical protein